jgi:hypothetical protein
MLSMDNSWDTQMEKFPTEWRQEQSSKNELFYSILARK